MRLLSAALLVVALSAPAVSAQEDLAAVEKNFKMALQLQAEKPLEEAVRALLKINSPGAAKVVLGGLKTKGDVNIYWTLVRGAASFTGHEPLAEVVKFILENKGSALGCDLTGALHANFGEGIEGAVLTLLKQGPPELAIVAIEHLQDVGNKETVTAVLELLQKGPGSEDLKLRLFQVLRCLLNADYGESLSNWQGWWDANKEKPWDALKARQGSGANTGTVADGLKKTEYERLKTGKIMVLGAGDKCKCKKNHDLDNIDQIISRMGLQVVKVDKVAFGKPDCKPEDYVAIAVNCTFIETHCVCPKCKPGGASDLRRFT